MFSYEDWEAINIDSNEYGNLNKREDRGPILDSFKDKVNEASNTINNAANDAGNKINDAVFGDNAGDNIQTSISNQWDKTTGKLNETWVETKAQYEETKMKIEKIQKILAIIPWVIGISFVVFSILLVVLVVSIIKHHNKKSRLQNQKIEELTKAVNNLTRIYCKQNNIEDFNVEEEEEEEESVKITVDSATNEADIASKHRTYYTNKIEE